MSLEGLCNIHEVDIVLASATTGAQFGVAYNETTIATGRRCRVRELSASESNKHSSRGMHVDHLVYFSSDPGVGLQHRLVWKGKTMQVRGVRSCNDDSTALLWVVSADSDTSRGDQ